MTSMRQALLRCFEMTQSVAGGIHLRTFRHELIVAVAYVTLCPDPLTLMNICEA